MGPSMSVCLSRFLQQWTSGPIVGTRCFVTMTPLITAQNDLRNTLLRNNGQGSQYKNDLRRNNELDHISATTIYVIWREEHLWNINVLQRRHISNLVCSKESQSSAVQ
jgi:hypothetical protein